jgi:hypothetical protein
VPRHGIGQAEANSAAWRHGKRLLERAIAERLSFAFETTLGGHTIAAPLDSAPRAGVEVRIWERFYRNRLNPIQLMPRLSELRVYNSTEADPHAGAAPEPMLLLQMARATLVQCNWNGESVQFSASTGVLALVLANHAAVGRQSQLDSKVPPGIVIGFVGGLVHPDSSAHSEVQLAARLRNDYPLRVQVRLFENRRGGQAHREILRMLDVNHDGAPSAAEKLDARIAIYGHSWGASEAVALARVLQKEGIPVLLTVQVDSIAKPGQDDESIPANVAQAINFYQRRGLLRGRARIRAADATRTQILGNFQFDYSTHSIDCAGYPWYARAFMKPHIEIESDPSVWRQVESLIRSKFLAR